ncbi:hypothetical protein N9B72_00295 [Bacteriovoracaceae bacterium]|nr:hypothetical protein [Bacteriovoracaceae bacterium]
MNLRNKISRSKAFATYCILMLTILLHSCATKNKISYSVATDAKVCKVVKAYLVSRNINHSTFRNTPLMYIKAIKKDLGTSGYVRLKKYHTFYCVKGYVYKKLKNKMRKDIEIIYNEKRKRVMLFRKSHAKSLILNIKKNRRKRDKVASKEQLGSSFNRVIRLDYPNTKGKIKTQAKRIRKEFLQKSLLNTMYEIFKIPVENDAISSHLDEYFPGQFRRAPFKKITSKVNSYINKYFISWDFLQKSNFKKVYDMGEADFYYYSPGTTRDNLSDKESNLKMLLSDKKNRQEIMGAILIAEAGLNIKRISKEKIEISYKIDLPTIIKKYPFTRISKHKYQSEVTELKYDNTSQTNKLRETDVLKSKLNVVFKLPYKGIRATTQDEAEREKKRVVLEELSAIYGILYRLPSTNKSISEYLESFFFGPFKSFGNMGNHRKSLLKSLHKNGLIQDWYYKNGEGKLVNSFDLKLRGLRFDDNFERLTKYMNFINSSYSYDKEDFEYWKRDGEDRKKEEALENILKNQQTKYNALGFIIASYSRVKIKRKKAFFLIQIEVDFRKIIKNHRPRKISDFIEQ